MYIIVISQMFQSKHCYTDGITRQTVTYWLSAVLQSIHNCCFYAEQT